MGMKLSRGFSVKGATERAFELTQSYVTGMNYHVESSNKPNLLALRRGSKWTLSTKIENVLTKLAISFTQKGEIVYVLCDFEVQAPAIYTSGDRATLENEVEKLRAFLETAL